MAATVSRIGTAKSISTAMPIVGSGLATGNASAIEHSQKPRHEEPISPKYILAGGKFLIQKPAMAAIVSHASIASGRKNDSAAQLIIANEAAWPSSPSIKLNALIIPMSNVTARKNETA